MRVQWALNFLGIIGAASQDARREIGAHGSRGGACNLYEIPWTFNWQNQHFNLPTHWVPFCLIYFSFYNKLLNNNYYIICLLYVNNNEKESVDCKLYLERERAKDTVLMELKPLSIRNAAAAARRENAPTLMTGQWVNSLIMYITGVIVFLSIFIPHLMMLFCQFAKVKKL